LHEEIIATGGLLKEGRLVRMNVKDVDDALAAETNAEPSEKVKGILLDLYRKNMPTLAILLEARMKDRTRGLATKLSEREAKETEDIRFILTELRRTIEEKLDDPNLRQLTFEGWADAEREQLERNMSALRARVLEIPGDIERETAAVKARFADPQPRMFPVAVTFLVPERLAKG
jgi:hypothetical protein